MKKQPKFSFGQQITVTNFIEKGYEGNRLIWDEQRFFESGKGWLSEIKVTVIGKRTLSTGEIVQGHYDSLLGYNEPVEYHGSHYFTAWLVAYSLYRKPVFVLEKHILETP